MGEKLIRDYLEDILLRLREIEQVKRDAKDLGGFKITFIFEEQQSGIF